VSFRGALTRIDARCLTPCHLSSVSNSCHFSECQPFAPTISLAECGA
jgi:hypothetical protein